MKSVMTNRFSEVPAADIPRSTFDRSHGIKTTFDAGYLIPFYLDEALPGDTHNVQANLFARLATPINPVMDNMRLETFYFSIPFRLVWDNFQKFMGERINPGDSIDYTIPIINSDAAGYANQSIHDYFGLPTQVLASYEHSALWHRALYLTWNEWFRDQNIQNSLTVATGDGPDLHSAYTLQRRGKRHDYFTSCLPWPQKGDAVSIPLGTSAPVTSDLTAGLTVGVKNPTLGTSTYVLDSSLSLLSQSSLTTTNNPLYADLSTATSATINQLREAFQVQKLLERDARAGTRYTEIIRSHFGVTSPDQRLQRPEYLGGGSTPINVTPVAQTSSTDATTPQGNLSGYGTVFADNHGFVKSFTEHCLIIGLVNVRADLTYQQGLNRMFSRSTRYDFYWPALAHIGEQAVLSKEIYVDGTANDEDVFGYQERFAEYRYKPSMITGKFRSNDAGSLDPWHLSQEFLTRPTLSSTFIEDNPPIDRVIAVPSEPHFIMDGYIQVRSARPMPVNGVPGLIDHF